MILIDIFNWTIWQLSAQYLVQQIILASVRTNLTFSVDLISMFLICLETEWKELTAEKPSRKHLKL